VFTQRRLPFRLVAAISLSVLVFDLLWAALVLGLHVGLELEFLSLPFLPIATIGTAVAFYVGFKNNSAYDRFWEARKIWGGVVNTSRAWANAVLSYVDTDEHAPELHRELIFRQLAWINALRLQLRRRSRFAAWREKRAERFAWVREQQAALRSDWDTELGPLLSAEELASTHAVNNPATQLIRRQGAQLRALVEAGRLELFRQISMMALLDELYTLQGQCERIKNTPFPRQYAYFASLFTWVFVLLVPLGLLSVFDELRAQSAHGNYVPAIALVICSGLIGWVFRIMEFVGDNSEDPFEGGVNDVPMNALCRTIEIDLRQMLGDADVPENERAVHDVLY
jgi:ion channel-forming bestrophin family protein